MLNIFYYAMWFVFMLGYKMLIVNGKKAGMRENVREVCVLRKTIYNYTGMFAPPYLRP